jgi:hypothetical protein
MYPKYLNKEDIIQYAIQEGYKLKNISIDDELLFIKEWIRIKFKIFIENNLGERGSMNRKTKEYYTVSMSKRIPHPTKKGMRYNNRCSHETKDTYDDAFCEGIIWALNWNNNGSLQQFLNKKSNGR